MRSGSRSRPGGEVALEGFQPERGSGQELHDTVVEIARQRQPRPCLGAFLDGDHQRVPFDVTGNVRGDLRPDIDVIGGQVGEVFEEQLAFAGTSAHGDREAFT